METEDRREGAQREKEESRSRSGGGLGLRKQDVTR